MISIITTLKNRANLLRYGLEGILRQDYWGKSGDTIELNIGDGGSDDGLDDLLLDMSRHPSISIIKKYTIDRTKSVYNHTQNCPAEELNMLVKLSNNPTVIKLDPEAVLVDNTFISESMEILQKYPESIIMPFPLHCYKFNYDNFDDILLQWGKYSFKTHIQEDNARDTNVYYLAVFNKDPFIKLGGIDEQFIQFRGSEDNHFLNQWQQHYGYDSRITLLNRIVLHLYHDELGNGHIPTNLMMPIHQGQELAQRLKNTPPNFGRDWGRFNSITKKEHFYKGRKVYESKPF